jgi:arginyl-tRNA synthetase
MDDTSAGERQEQVQDPHAYIPIRPEQVQDPHTYLYTTHIHTLVLGDDKKKFKTRSGEVTKLVDLLDEVPL